MKAATGELSLTVITVVAIGVIAALFAVLWPSIKNRITNTWSGIDKDMNKIQGTYVMPTTGFKFTSESYTISVK